MNPARFINPLLTFCLLIILVISLSYITNRLWGNPPERETEKEQFVTTASMTVADYGQVNNIPQPVLAKIFNFSQDADTGKYLSDFAMSPEQLLKTTRVEVAQNLEENSKNPIRFTIHFVVYTIFMVFVFYLLVNMRITPKKRNWLYLAAIVIFGLGFNANPSPMGPLRDTIALFSNPGEIIHPRLFAILTFLVFVVVANKFICSWVCQLGVLQDLIFRLNHKNTSSKGLYKQYKLPFIFTNSIRIVFFVLISVISALWALSVISWIDPFNIFNPTAASISAWIFIGIMLFLSLIVYRPWCHLFCPFGLLGWLFERISIYKIKVSYNACTACGICSKSCPSSVMEAILKGKKTIPDCFSCGACITKCPTGAIKFDLGKRSMPPVGFFKSEGKMGF